jgi:hypothetical protein
MKMLTIPKVWALPNLLLERNWPVGFNQNSHRLLFLLLLIIMRGESNTTPPPQFFCGKLGENQCCGSMTFWVDPDPDPDPRIHASD